jgi:hypothetical protein
VTVSRWLQQQVQPQHPDVEILEVFTAVSGYYPVDAATCNQWLSKTGATHPVLRDKGGASSVEQTLSLQLKDMMVLDRNLKIVYRQYVASTFTENQVLSTLGQLK